MVERLKKMLAEGKECRIFTARVSGPVWANTPEEYQRQRQAIMSRKAIEEWCQQHIGQVLDVTCAKDYGMIELYDDRVVQVVPNTGELAVEVAHRQGYALGSIFGPVGESITS
jgi:hypothetical protein